MYMTGASLTELFIEALQRQETPLRSDLGRSCRLMPVRRARDITTRPQDVVVRWRRCEQVRQVFDQVSTLTPRYKMLGPRRHLASPFPTIRAAFPLVVDGLLTAGEWLRPGTFQSTQSSHTDLRWPATFWLA